MLKLKLQYFGHLMRRTDSVEKTLMLGKIEGRRRQGQQRMRWLDGWMADYIIQNSRMDEAQAGIKLAGRNINHLRCADDTTQMAESEEELKSLLIKVKEESEKVGLKLNFRKRRSWHPITSWEIDGETVSDFILGAPKSLQMVVAAMKLKYTYSLEGKL